jgi:hypothetical protein
MTIIFLGTCWQGEGVGGIEEEFAVELHRRQLDRGAAGGDENVLGLERELAIGAFDFDRVGAGEAGHAADVLDFVFLQQRGDAAR